MKIAPCIFALLLACQPFVANMTMAAEKTGVTTQALKDEVVKLNINTATETQLMTLKGISEKKAAAIVAYRTEHGNFASLEQLAEVKGISPRFGEEHVSELSLK